MNPVPKELDKSLHRELVLDTSSLINIVSTQHAVKILKSFSGRLMIDEMVKREALIFPGIDVHPSEVLADLSERGLISVVSMNEIEAQTFADLVSGGTFSSLGDGESATLSLALHRKGVAVIDEKKAARVATEYMPPIDTMTTVDLFRDSSVADALGENHLSDAVFNALFNARMRVSHSHEGWVRELIGDERSMNCSSLKRRL